MRWESLLGGFISLLVVGAAILAYWIKTINWSKGYGFSLFGIGRDLDIFAKITKNEEDARLHRRYRLILWVFYVCVCSAAMTVLAVGLFGLWWRYNR